MLCKHLEAGDGDSETRAAECTAWTEVDNDTEMIREDVAVVEDIVASPIVSIPCSPSNIRSLVRFVAECGALVQI